MILDSDNKRYIIDVEESQYYISIQDLISAWYKESGNPLNVDTPKQILYKFLLQLFNKDKSLFTELKFVIQYTYKDERKHTVYNNYYDAIRVYHKMIRHNIYNDIKPNFDIDNTILESFDMFSAYQYNEELKKNIGYEESNDNNIRSIDINLLD